MDVHVMDITDGSLESEPFSHDDNSSLKWKLVYDEPRFYLEAVTGENSKFQFLVTVQPSRQVSDNVQNVIFIGKKIQIGSNINSMPPYRVMFNMIIQYPNEDFETNLAKIELPDNRLVRGQYCDVNFIVGKETIPFYKLLLAQKSDVFDTMFSSPVNDPQKANDPIEIKDVSAVGFKAFLDVIYDGKSPKDAEVPLEVLKIADRYNCKYVQQVVGSSLSKLIKKDNAMKIFVAAGDYDIKSLKEAVLKFLRDNPVHELPDAEMLARNPPLMLEVIKNVYKKQKTSK